MKEMTNDEIKKIGLEILSDIHEFCIKNDIKYSLAYGTLIGAVRHKGFIPWDDDIDIIMPREDYERFFRTFSSKKYLLACPSLKNSYLLFGRVYEKNRTYCRPWRPQCTSDDIGVWIDIFPIDNVPDLNYKFNEMAKNMMNDFVLSHSIRSSMISFKEIGYIHIKSIIKLFIDKIKFKKYKLLEIVERADSYARSINSETGFKGSIICPIYSSKEILPSEIFSQYINVDFESHSFRALERYDEYLRNYYNDYMKLPPINKRTYPHSAHKFYWK